MAKLYQERLLQLPSWTSLEQEQTQAIALADVDGDGDLDMGVGNWNSRTKVLENVAGVFGEPLWEGEDLIDCDGMAFGDMVMMDSLNYCNGTNDAGITGTNTIKMDTVEC